MTFYTCFSLTRRCELYILTSFSALSAVNPRSYASTYTHNRHLPTPHCLHAIVCKCLRNYFKQCFPAVIAMISMLSPMTCRSSLLSSMTIGTESRGVRRLYLFADPMALPCNCNSLMFFDTRVIFCLHRVSVHHVQLTRFAKPFLNSGSAFNLLC